MKIKKTFGGGSNNDEFENLPPIMYYIIFKLCSIKIYSIDLLKAITIMMTKKKKKKKKKRGKL